MDYVEIINYFSVINETSLSCLLKEKEREATLFLSEAEKMVFCESKQKNEK